jgi:hypothetical protein
LFSCIVVCAPTFQKLSLHATTCCCNIFYGRCLRHFKSQHFTAAFVATSTSHGKFSSSVNATISSTPAGVVTL